MKEVSMGRKDRKISQKAFTLVEILIVVTIVAILATLIIPKFSASIRKARTSEATGIMSVIREGALGWSDEHGGTVDFATIATDVEDNIKSALTVDWEVPRHGWTFELAADGTVTAVRDGDDANTLTLSLGGEWCGTGIYDPADGTDWPQLTPHC